MIRPTTTIFCDGCKAEKSAKGDRIPHGWHRHSGIFCGQCWGKRFVLRAVTFPVVGPVDGEWADLRRDLASAWAASTSLANWAITELSKNDVIRGSKDKKCPKMPAIYLYGLAGKKFSGWGQWAGSMQSANSVLRAAEQKYRAARYETIWTRDRSLLSFRYPFPIPIHNAAWTAATINQCPTVNVAIGGRRWTLRLKGGSEMARQLKAFRQIESGEAVQGELAIYRVRANASDNRPSVSEASPAASRQHYRVMAKLVAWLPRGEAVAGNKTMLVRTDPNAFVVAETLGFRPWVLNGDHAKRWQAEHAVYRQRMSEDTKFEKRWPKRKREQINAARERRCEKNTNRINTFIDQSIAMIVGLAMRRGACEVIFDDKCRDYLPSFPWHRFKTRIKSKLDEAGVTLTAAKDDEQAA